MERETSNLSPFRGGFVLLIRLFERFGTVRSVALIRFPEQTINQSFQSAVQESRMNQNAIRGNTGRALLAGILFVTASSAAFAQSTSAIISGVIHDAQGAMVPGATITASHSQTGLSRQVQSSDNGYYTIANLPIGDYKVTITATGFKMAVIPSLTLQINQNAELDVALEVGAVSEQINVSSDVPLLTTESSSVGTVVDNRSIESLALNGRQFWQLVALVPGASYTPGGDRTRTGGSSIRSSAVNVQINGTGFIYNGWLLDGVDITEYEQGGTNIQPNVDALAEFKVESANMPAEYGHTPNAVSATMKSGTNAFHGTVFEFIRNDKLDARNFFAVTKNALKRNQFGGAVGGPIKRNKVFFFTDYEATRQRQGLVFNDTLPTDAMRAGNFSGSKAITDPLTGAAFPGNIIPVTRISSQAQFFLKYMPTQQQGSFNAPQALDTNKGDLKVDAQLTQADHLMSRYSVSDNQEADPNQYPALGIQGLHSRAQNLVLTETHVFNPRWLNELRLGYYRDYFLFGAVLAGTNFLQQAGITGFEQTQLDPSFPLINLTGYTGFSGSGSNSLPKANRIRTWQYTDTASYSNGKHDMKFGAQLYHQTHGFFNGQSQEGQFTFNGNYTTNGFADYLLGLPSSVFRAYPLSLYGNIANQWALFLQDTYRVKPNLTFNLGIRWEYNPFFNGIGGQTSAIDYNTGKIVVPMHNGQLLNPTAQPEIPLLLPLFSDRLIGTDTIGRPDSIRNTGPGQWVPRVGFAWRPKGSDRLVVRGAYGIFTIFFDTNLSLQWAKTPPFEITQTVNNTVPAPTFTWASPFLGQPLVAANPNPGKPCAGSNLVLLTCVAPNVFAAPLDLQHTYMQQYNFAVQSEIVKGLSLDVAFVGNHTSHSQLISVPDNVPAPGPGAIQARRQFQQWGQFSVGLTNGIANYDALQVKLEKRFAQGFQLLGSYTYSKCMDLGSNQSGPITVGMLHQNYAVCDYNLPQNLTVSSVYELPFGKGRHYLNNVHSAINAVLGGWEVAGILSTRSGLPFTPVISGDRANTGVGGQRPNRTGNGSLDNPTVSRWFNLDAFSIPALYTYGNSGRNILRADNLVTVDMTFRKNFVLRETRRLEFRMEAFNIANHPTFSAPNTTIGTAAAGTITSTLNSGRTLQGAVKLYF
jgi:Carboxypeptidase regulatory-like domain/TonB dependent receptor-like, beta-barrel